MTKIFYARDCRFPLNIKQFSKQWAPSSENGGATPSSRCCLPVRAAAQGDVIFRGNGEKKKHTTKGRTVQKQAARNRHAVNIKVAASRFCPTLFKSQYLCLGPLGFPHVTHALI